MPTPRRAAGRALRYQSSCQEQTAFLKPSATSVRVPSEPMYKEATGGSPAEIDPFRDQLIHMLQVLERQDQHVEFIKRGQSDLYEGLVSLGRFARGQTPGQTSGQAAPMEMRGREPRIESEGPFSALFEHAAQDFMNDDMGNFMDDLRNECSELVDKTGAEEQRPAPVATKKSVSLQDNGEHRLHSLRADSIVSKAISFSPAVSIQEEFQQAEVTKVDSQKSEVTKTISRKSEVTKVISGLSKADASVPVMMPASILTPSPLHRYKNYEDIAEASSDSWTASSNSGRLRRGVTRRPTKREAETIEQQLERVIRGKEILEYDYWESIVKKPWFEIFFAMLNLLNIVLMAMELQYAGAVAAADNNFTDFPAPPSWIDDMLKITDKIVLGLFTFELVVKLILLRRKFWRDGWNLMDFVIVLFGLLDATVDIAVGLDPTMLRLVRLVKLIRFLKMFKMAGNLFILNLIMKSVKTTLPTLAWCVLLLLLVQTVFGLMIGQLVHGFITDEKELITNRERVYIYYGSFSRVMFTMMEITFVNYAVAARVLTSNINESFAWFFVLYRCLVSFALLNVIRAIFIQQTMKVAENDRELLLMSRERQKASIISKLTDVFKLFDFQGNGQLSELEFMSIFNIPRMQAWMAALDIDPRFPDNLFHLLDLEGTGLIDAKEFIEAASKLRGPANSVDLIHLASVANRIEAKLNVLLPDEKRSDHSNYTHTLYPSSGQSVANRLISGDSSDIPSGIHT